MTKHKWLGLFMAGALILSACNEGTDAEPADDAVGGNDNESEEVEEVSAEEGTNELDVTEILTRSTEAMNEVNSFSSEMTIDQVMDLGQDIPDLETSEITTSIEMKMDVILEPFGMYQLIDMDMGIPELGGPMQMESYFTEDGMYVYEPTMDMWAKYPASMTEEILALSEMDVSPEEQVELLQSFSDDVSVEEDGDVYVLTVSGSDDNLMELIESMMSMTDAGEMADMQMMMEMMDISEIDYVLTINKETYYQESIDMNMTMTMEAEGETATITQKMVGTFYGYNELDSIEIPEDVIENAHELTEEDLGMPVE
ncbi:DUF6612 family protein [Alkalihalobacillus trypoxylicola]|uniref:Lipoprotein n=1 Tax=Alkalihalobacillus trypoxylicola TaxID=519424 RepID=A0A161Q922_9BACI|nr:DUF6612 family protein [Alkalihalobacillus trypoxylicola]KYG33721.1 hypothetical protein AZF04_15975 [Alkalihalobacillus trypoxylicola]